MWKRMSSINSRIVLCFELLVVCLVIITIYYFVSVTSRIEDEVYASLRRDGALIGNRVESMLDTAIKTAQGTGYTSCLQKSIFSDDAGEIISNITTSRELIGADKDADPFIVDLFYYSQQGHLYTISEYYKAFHDNMDLYGFREDIRINQTFISKERIPDERTRFYFVYTPIYRTAPGIAHHTKEMGICGILCDFSMFLNQAEELFEDEYTCYVLYNGEIVSSSNPIEAVDETDLSMVEDGVSKLKLEKEKYYIFSDEQDDWRVVCIAPRSATSIQKVGVDKSFSLLIALVVFCFAIFLFAMNTQVTAQTNRMVAELNSMKASSEKKRLTIPRVAELESVAVEINNMLDRLEESAEWEQEAREKLLASAVAQKEAEMMAYRSQINPHFFFNTLECVRSMAQYYHAEMIEDIISAMSKMFRYSLYSERHVKLAQEIDMLEQYFRITSYRFPDKYSLEKEIGERVLELQVPSMILQPLVENSIKHAFKNVDKPCKVIRVTAFLVGEEQVKITVSDNGCGMTAEELERLKQEDNHAKDSIGIRNIYERIKLFHPENSMEFFSEKGVYTRVELILHASRL